MSPILDKVQCPSKCTCVHVFPRCVLQTCLAKSVDCYFQNLGNLCPVCCWKATTGKKKIEAFSYTISHNITMLLTVQLAQQSWVMLSLLSAEVQHERLISQKAASGEVLIVKRQENVRIRYLKKCNGLHIFCIQIIFVAFSKIFL